MFDGKPCRTNYKGIQLQPFEGGTVHGFPANPEEQTLEWKRVLPNNFKDEVKDHDGKIKKTIGVCYKYFPTNCQKKEKSSGILQKQSPGGIL